MIAKRVRAEPAPRTDRPQEIRMPVIDAPNWAEIRHAFEHSLETVEVIARRYRVTSSQIAYRARARRWIARPSGAEALAIARLKRSAGMRRPSHAEPLGPPEYKGRHSGNSGAKRGGGAGSLPHRRVMIVRIYEVIETKLREIEGRLAGKRNLDTAAAERETREIGTLIKNFEKLTELSDAHAASAARHAAPAAAAHDAERLREDLVRRLERIRSDRRDRPPARQPDGARAGGVEP